MVLDEDTRDEEIANVPHDGVQVNFGVIADIVERIKGEDLLPNRVDCPTLRGFIECDSS